MYTLYTSYYHRGDITIDQLLERFWELYNRRRVNGYDNDGIWENLILPAMILEYYSLAAGRAEPETARSLLERRRKAEPVLIEPQLEYIREFSGAGYEPALIRSICDVLISLRSLENATFKDLAIRIIMQRHSPTYIHSQMVAKIASAFAMGLVQRQPERFAGLLGTHDRDEILSRKEEIHRIVCNAGYVVDLLDAPVLTGQLREILDTGRIGLYIECYQHFQ